MSKVLEIVEFRFKQGTSEAAGLAAIEKSSEFAKEQKGFLGRWTANNSEAQWVEAIQWEDMESAQAANDKFVADQRNADLMGLLDQESLKMSHYDLKLSCQA